MMVVMGKEDPSGGKEQQLGFGQSSRGGLFDLYGLVCVVTLIQTPVLSDAGLIEGIIRGNCGIM